MEVEIGAPRERVWAELTDFAGFSQWNPFITHLSGKLAVAARLSTTYSFPDGGETRIHPEIVVLHPPRELRWRSRWWLPSILSVEYFWLLAETPGGATRFAQGENLSGLAVKYLGQQHTRMARAMVAMNQALKQRAESAR